MPANAAQPHQLLIFIRMGNHFVEAQAQPGRNLCGMVDGSCADAAFRLVDDPAQADIIRRITDYRKISKRIANLLALIETVAADHTVWHAHTHKSALNCV